MLFRFITKSIHTCLIGYPVAIVLMVAPFLLKLGKSSPVAPWLSVVTRVMALLLPVLTDHATGLVRVIRYWLHLWVDCALGAVSITAPPVSILQGLTPGTTGFSPPRAHFSSLAWIVTDDDG
ncbi:hypothetical protein SAMN05443247_10384 [Bradyrhizobium erythrophlei]|nr:hypothetical protein SAMN05443247_10384 [Bradyrhizobium erythrophlei]